jgi:ketosteroid isomerase-like protein
VQRAGASKPSAGKLQEKSRPAGKDRAQREGAPGKANAALIKRFYAALNARDAESMIACYARDVRFKDPAFGELDAAGATAMWRMLCARGADLRVAASNIVADAATGHAHWDATYTFSTTGRRVVNHIDAAFEFRAGRIARHEDRFDLYRWARQALGLKGLLLGWLPPVQKVIRAEAAKALAAWRAENRP